jgi:hypothetical protein
MNNLLYEQSLSDSIRLPTDPYRQSGGDVSEAQAVRFHFSGSFHLDIAPRKSDPPETLDAQIITLQPKPFKGFFSNEGAGISAYLPRRAAEPTREPSTCYLKNGILVRHTGQTITAEAVRKALDEE